MSDLETALQRALDQKTKPIGSLGRLEALALQVGLLQATTTPTVSKPRLLLFAADHGLASAAANTGISAYPQEVTWQMVMNFVAGGAASSVLAHANGVAVDVIDVGVAHDFDRTLAIHPRKIAAGTANMLETNAMSEAQMQAALQVGRDIALAAISDGSNVLALGEMGIGNTSSASLLMASLCQIPLSECVGRGTGLDDAALERKRAVLQTVLERRSGLQAMTIDAALALQRFGGFEIAAIVGAMIAAAQQRALVVVDGFIVSAAALVALKMQPSIRPALVFAHQSAEQAHRHLLSQIDAKPLLQLDMRLGEGTGALLAIPLIRCAVAILNEMASFASAGVSTADTATQAKS
jgi:nicotinate-nucleotide--dimethylbenzimidazole phosphoribosyltransferase